MLNEQETRWCQTAIQDKTDMTLHGEVYLVALDDAGSSVSL
jgi:hypothetical protein